jgi:HPt (histidine-containing phosphotransfer) domain-containing protein
MSDAANDAFPTLDKAIVERLLALRKEGEPSLFIKVVKLYDLEVKRLTDAIKISFDNNDPNLLYESIHSLKSCSGNIGATRLAFLCQDLLEKIKQDKTQLKLFHALYSAIEHELGSVKKQIASYMQDQANAN